MLRAVPHLPCVDDAEPFFCDFEIIMNEACTDQSRKFLMMDRCRYSCNFCKYCLLRICTREIFLLKVACVQTITKLWLVPSAKQRRDPCSGPPTDSTNYRKCVSNSPSTWLAITTTKTKAFFNWPIVARTQIWVNSWKSRTRRSALFRRRS